MKKYLILGGIAPMIGVLLLMVLAYGHSFNVERMCDDRMHRDILGFTQDLQKTGMSPAQVQTFSTVLLDMNRNIIGYVSSETSNLVCVFSFMSIIILSFSLALAGRITEQKKE